MPLTLHITEHHIPYALPIIREEQPALIAKAVAKISAIVKARAIDLLSDKPVHTLEYELTLLAEQIWNDGYNQGLKAGEKIN